MNRKIILINIIDDVNFKYETILNSAGKQLQKAVKCHYSAQFSLEWKFVSDTDKKIKTVIATVSLQFQFISRNSEENKSELVDINTQLTSSQVYFFKFLLLF